ncbi:WXG100 family type VII secretion target [Kitasatospora griseola]|uniref:WXG100 family type VII secretion target n=1 Tax=Kitasatospora griseola TaxID=2064 RepID=UPI0036DA5467
MVDKRFIRAVHDDGGEIGGASHEQLIAMVQHSDPIAVMQVVQRLLAAAQKMDEIGDELHAHMSGLDWEGAAADNFKSWGSEVSKSTMELADYSRAASTHLAPAGDVLAAVKSGIPPVPHDDMETVSRYDGQPNGAVNTGGDILGGVLGIGGSAGRWAAGEVAGFVDSDWVTPAQAQAAQQRVDQAHNEAIQEMTKLTQAYDESIRRLKALVPPTFPPPPPPPRPPGGEAWHDDSVDVSVGDGNGRTGRKPGDGNPVIWEPPGPPKPPKPQPPEPPIPVPPPIPRPPLPPEPPGPVPPPTPHPPLPPHPPVPVPPPTPIQDPTTRIDHTPTQSPPDPTIPVTGGGGGGGGTGGGGYGSGGGLGGSGGGGGYQGGPIPGGGGYSGGSAGAGRTGGTTATPTGTGQAGQAGQAGRAGASGMGGGMPHGGAGAGGARGKAGGGARGSGLVNRAGGTVGGRRGPAAGGEFTPGGTGLRARGERGADGRAGQGGFGGGQGGANRKGKPQGKRPDYLIEDEDTWTSGMGPANPGVIE